MASRLTSVLLSAVAPVHSASALTVTITRSAPGVLVSAVRGHLNAAGARVLGDSFLSLAAREKCHLRVFHDWSEMTDYDGEARVLLTDVASVLVPLSEAIHFFVTAPAVVFGVRAANLILKKLTAHATGGSYDAALEGALAHATRMRNA